MPRASSFRLSRAVRASTALEAQARVSASQLQGSDVEPSRRVSTICSARGRAQTVRVNRDESGSRSSLPLRSEGLAASAEHIDAGVARRPAGGSWCRGDVIERDRRRSKSFDRSQRPHAGRSRLERSRTASRHAGSARAQHLGEVLGTSASIAIARSRTDADHAPGRTPEPSAGGLAQTGLADTRGRCSGARSRPAPRQEADPDGREGRRS